MVREMEGTSQHFGWIESLLIHSSPLFSERSRVELGKLSLLIGENGVGKTAICDWLCGSADISYLDRWHYRKTVQPTPPRVDAEVRYLDPESHTVRFSFSESDFPRYDSDGRADSHSVTSMKVIFPKRLNLDTFQKESRDELDLLSDTLGMNPYLVRSLCDRVSSVAGVNRLGFERHAGVVRLVADVEGAYRPNLPLHSLSHSECERVLMAIATVAANDYALR